MGEIFKLDNELGESEKWIQHYSSHHKILLVGEGDFSFAACSAKSFGSADNKVATSLDSKELLMAKYSRAASNLKELEESGCTILHEVDAHTMSQHPMLYSKSFDRIVFNFPHAGFHFNYREHDLFLIQRHQELVRGFLKSAMNMLKENGEIHVTHKTAYPFNRWEIEMLGVGFGLRLVEKVPFYLWHYPGYQNKRGDGSRCDESFPVGVCSSFKFAKK
ncbi:hypothetical protein CICLE_v10010347mg [Citrus x clementina]|uniref:25S rRNA (uridine-N(3))-methyltransferase BMT5-like domain-containing protein n=1 Tax=Citrus clementina TaxID=85681 RepID=V4UII5_CITCL|nr:uncharacterized protein At4g26485 [Citrus x clementina]ESR65942.1 hypothetical protein CICLE_v10010347mg [Citrus x clementina]